MDRGRAVGSRSPHFPRARCCSGHSGHFMASKMETLKTGQREDFLKILNVVSNFFETTWLTIPELSTGRISRLLGTATCPPPPREGRHCGGRLSQCRRRPEVDQDTDEKIQRLSRTGECGPAMFNKVEGCSTVRRGTQVTSSPPRGNCGYSPCPEAPSVAPPVGRRPSGPHTATGTVKQECTDRDSERWERPCSSDAGLKIGVRLLCHWRLSSWRLEGKFRWRPEGGAHETGLGHASKCTHGLLSESSVVTWSAKGLWACRRGSRDGQVGEMQQHASVTEFQNLCKVTEALLAQSKTMLTARQPSRP